MNSRSTRPRPGCSPIPAAWENVADLSPELQAFHEYQAFLEENPNNRTAIEQLPKTQPQDSARVFIPNGDQNLGRAWEQILVNDVPAQEAFDEVAAQLEEDKVPVLEALDAIEG